MAAFQAIHDLSEARRQRISSIDAQLARTDAGAVIASVSNLILIIGQDPVLAEMCAFDDFRGIPVIRCAAPSPLDGAEKLPGPFPRQWSAADVSHVQSYIQRSWAVRRATRGDTEDAMLAVATMRRFHPVKDWLASLKYDGKKRLDTWLQNSLGCPNDEYHSAVGAKFLIAAVRRVRHPGCKFDHMPVLEGAQGIGKSKVCRTLFSDPWFTDALPAALESKEAAQALQGIWLVEFAEIEQIIRNEVEVIKAFLSRPIDRFRAPYAKAFLEYPRQSVLVGTTNDGGYLRDSTGNRRFWPVRCEWADAEWVAENREQLFAEAAAREAAGEEIWLSDTDLSKTAAQHQADRLQDDVWDDRVVGFLSSRRFITIPEILTENLLMPVEKQGKREQMRIADILKRNGWQRFTRRDGPRTVKRWERIGPLNGAGGNGVVTPEDATKW